MVITICQEFRNTWWNKSYPCIKMHLAPSWSIFLVNIQFSQIFYSFSIITVSAPFHEAQNRKRDRDQTHNIYETIHTILALVVSRPSSNTSPMSAHEVILFFQCNCTQNKDTWNQVLEEKSIMNMLQNRKENSKCKIYLPYFKSILYTKLRLTLSTAKGSIQAHFYYFSIKTRWAIWFRAVIQSPLLSVFKAFKSPCLAFSKHLCQVS